jgi:conjugative transfer pilus assembly protein TraH
MRIIPTSKAVIGLILLLSIPSYAAIDNDLKDFFNKVGMSNNINSSGAYQDQAAGYYTGGSLSARSSVRNMQLATIQMPGFRAGCGGIDAWGGGFSHITAPALIEMFRDIGSSALSYAFLLSLETISPQIYNLINELNAIATKVNNLNINSCETAATMLGGIWPKSDQASKHLCQAMGANLGAFSDWSAARHGCGANGDRDSVLSKKNSDVRYKDLLVGEFNLTWKALQLNAFLNSDQELAQLFMTLVGSIISRKEGAPIKTSAKMKADQPFTLKILPGHSDSDDLLNGLLNGGNTPIYICDNKDQCLYPKLAMVNVSQEHALLRKVHATLAALLDKVYEDTAITKAEQDFLNSTRLPVYKMLNVTTAYRKGAAPVDLHQYGDLIALDLLYKYVVEVLDLVHDSIAQLKEVQVNNKDVESLLNQLRIAREKITVRRSSAFQQMDSVLSFIQATQVIEKQLHVMLGSVANESNWY